MKRSSVTSSVSISGLSSSSIGSDDVFSDSDSLELGSPSPLCYVAYDRLGSLSKDHGKENRKDSEKEESKMEALDPHLHDGSQILRSMSVREKREKRARSRKGLHGPPGDQLVQRCVIVQRDEKGYGLTVSGDNPVFVQSVKENGAAARAGVLQGDRIIKVNGTLVTNSNHIEVVKLIKSGSYVALTLLGRPPGSTKPLDPPPQPHYKSTATIPSPSSDRITGPQPVDAKKDLEYRSQKLATIRMMYDQAMDIYEKANQEFKHNPSEKLQQELTEKSKTVKTLEAQIQSLTDSPPEGSHMTTSLGATSPTDSSHFPHPFERSGSGDSLDIVNFNRDSQLDNSQMAAQEHNPAPWLRGGVKHRKHDSMPDSLYDSEEMCGARDATVARSHSDSVRSHSDSKKRRITPSDSLTGLAEKIDEDRTSSFPPSGYTDSDQSPQRSPAPSPTPMQQVSPSGGYQAMSPILQHATSPTIWMEDSVLTTDNADFEQNPVELTPKHVTHSGSSPTQDLVRQSGLQVNTPNQINVISTEDDEFSTDDEHLEDHGVFSDLNMVMKKPAHMAVLLHYVISNTDPSPLLFYLVTDSYTLGNTKEMRKWAYEIHSTFLADKAPLRVSVESTVVDNIDAVLTSKWDKEDSLRSVFQTARAYTLEESCELLADFRNKRSLGLGNLYGDHELHDDNMDRQAELKIVEKYLMPHLENLLSDNNASDRNTAMASALATFLRQVGVSQSRNSNILERCPSFNVKDKKMFKFSSKSNKKINYTKGHHFIAQHYYTVTYCNHCQGLIWGIGNQGYMCMNCECNIHKNCFEKIHELCPGRAKKKDKRTSIMDKIITRKPSSNDRSAIQAALKQHEEKNSPTKSPPGFATKSLISGTSMFHIDVPIQENPQKDETDSAVLISGADPSKLAAQSTRVGKLVDRYQDMGKSPSDDQRSPSTGSQLPPTPRSHSPVPIELEENRKVVNLNRSESLNRKKKKVPTATLR